MVNRAYILLDIVDDKAEQAIKVLRKNPSVVIADALEGPPDVIIVMEAPERQQLAKLTIQVLAPLESITENICLLPTKEKFNTATLPKLSRKNRRKTRSSKRFRLGSKVNSISLKKGE